VGKFAQYIFKVKKFTHQTTVDDNDDDDDNNNDNYLNPLLCIDLEHQMNWRLPIN